MEDIEQIMTSVISHRLQLKPSLKYLQTPEQYLEQEFSKFKQRKSGYT